MLRVLQIARVAKGSWRCLSSSNQELELISAGNDPRSHAPVDLGKIYTPRPEISSLFYKHALPTRAIKEVDSLGQFGLVLRKQSSDVISIIKNESGNSTGGKAVLYGKPGTGKTFALLNVVDFFMQSGWVVAHVPFGLRWTHRAGDLDASTHTQGAVDQNVDAAKWLQYFIESNTTALGKAPLVGKYTWGLRKIEMPANSTLLQLCNLGVREQRFAADVVGVVLKELRSANVPLLIAVDEVNGLLEAQTQTYGFDQKPLAPNRLTLINHFLELITGRKKLTNGGIVLATSSGNGVVPTGVFQPGMQKFIDQAVSQSTPSPEGFVKVHVPAFNDAEITTLLRYYKATGWISKNFDRKFKLGLKHLSDNVPQKVAEIARAI